MLRKREERELTTSGLTFHLFNDTSRKIIHIDMDAFYASVEERDHPEIKGKPVVVGPDPRCNGGHGVVATANYQARSFGIHSAMSTREALKRCPNLIFCPVNKEYYQQVSHQIHQIFRRYTDIIEPVALDEAYLDVTTNKIHAKSAIRIARLIQHDIWNELHLTCSAGVSYNKFLAKLASDYQKPAGLTYVLPDEAIDFLSALPIEKFKGVGRKTVPRMHELGIYRGSDLLKWSEMDLIQQFGKMGYELYRKVRGIHNEPVKAQKKCKSIGTEKTFHDRIVTEEQLIVILRKQAIRVAKTLDEKQQHAKTIVLKIRYGDFTTITKRQTFDYYIHQADELFDAAIQIWNEIDDFRDGIRLLGITTTNLESRNFEPIKLPL